eukprot:gene11342-12525_t
MATCMREVPLLGARGTTGLFVVEGKNQFQDPENRLSLQVADVNSGHVLAEIPKQKTSLLSFSPLGNFLSVWQGYFTTPDNPKGFNNLEIHSVKDGSVVKGFVQKKQDTWEPQWSDDEKLCARSVSNEVHFYEDGNFSSVAKKLFQSNITSFSLSPGCGSHRIAIFVKGTKAAPSFVRMFEYPRLDNQNALANKSFFKADKVNMFWNKKGTHLLILTITEVDTTGSSYYGEQALHFISSRGDSSIVSFDKKGPVYSVDWSPNSNEFCVEFWNIKDKKLISKPQASDSTYFQWAPNGVHFLTATLSPRLKIGNGYKIWHYTGKELYHVALSTNHELYQVEWQPALDGMYKEAAVVITSKPLTTPAKAPAYRPPSARASGKESIKLHELEPAENMKQQELSGSALKNKKKREAKIKPEAQQQPTSSEPNIGTTVTETEKKIRGLKKKLRQVQDLKAKQKEGKKLEKNQIDKINSEKDILLEIRELELNS